MECILLVSSGLICKIFSNLAVQVIIYHFDGNNFCDKSSVLNILF